MTNNTVQRVLELESELEKIKLSNMAIAFIESENKGELMDAANQFNAHLFHPFEVSDNDYYHFEYILKNKPVCKIIVKSKEHYRIQSTIKEI